MSDIVADAVSIDDRAIAAKQSKPEMERLIEEFGPFLRARAARYSTRVDEARREELFSAAMLGFYEAILSYDSEKGHFFPFANRVVCDRIIDNVRTIYRQRDKTISLDQQDEGTSPSRAAVAELSIKKHDAALHQTLLAEEIEQFRVELDAWGITLAMLRRQSPKHKKVRDVYKQAIATIYADPDIVQTIQLKRYFPVKAISQATGLSAKKLERARSFILAALIIRLGDFDYLSEYVQWDRW